MAEFTEKFNAVVEEHNTVVQTVADGNFTALHLEVLDTEPTSKPDGTIVYADGGDFNPGSGEGFYGRENGAWVKL